MFRFYVVGLLTFLGGCGSGPDKLSDTPTTHLNLEEGVSNAIATSTPSFLTNYQSCEQIKNDLRERAIKEIETQMAEWPDEAPEYMAQGGGCIGDALPAPGAISGAVPNAPEAKSGSGSAEGIDFSGTNNQEKGVDEADIIKIDGTYFYIVNGMKFEILAISNDGQLNPISSLQLEQEPSSILLMEDKAFIFSQSYYSGHDFLPKIRLDVVQLGENRQNPRIEHSYYFDGNLNAARKIGNKIHLATYFDADRIDLHRWPRLPDHYYESTPEQRAQIWAEAKAEARSKNAEIIAHYDFLRLLPHQLERSGDEFSPIAISEEGCARSFGAATDPASGFLSLISFTPEDQDIAIQRVRGNHPIVYASSEQFILASENNWQRWWENDEEKSETVIHRFKLDVDNVPSYADSVTVPGSLHNSFSLSEYNGYVRIATTTRRDWNTPGSVDKNHLFIVGEDSGQFAIISSIEDLAPGETIWSARFTKDKGFLVTFRQTDPLFTLDLSDPKKPVVAGELKVPGVSTYLQDIGNNQLLAVGYGGDEGGLDWQTSISLFDVSDFSHPRRATTLTCEPEDEFRDAWSGGQSEANSNHLAINYFAPAEMTAIPIYASRILWDEDGDEEPNDDSGNETDPVIIPPPPVPFPTNDVLLPSPPRAPLRWEHISKLKVIHTKPGADLRLLGEVDHSQFYNSDEVGYSDGQIRRSYFVGDYLYAFSARGITATRLSDMVTTSIYEIK